LLAELFSSYVGQHSDNFVAADLDRYYSKGVNPFVHDPYAQIRGTNTLIFTMGDKMEMPLSFPKDISDAGDRKMYVRHPDLTIPLMGGTLLIFHPLDDFFFCHEVRFPTACTDGGRHRTAFVFRWLHQQRQKRQFHLEPTKKWRLKHP
jgi:hypothetical protein